MLSLTRTCVLLVVVKVCFVASQQDGTLTLTSNGDNSIPTRITCRGQFNDTGADIRFSANYESVTLEFPPGKEGETKLAIQNSQTCHTQYFKDKGALYSATIDTSGYNHRTYSVKEFPYPNGAFYAHLSKS